MNVQQSLFAPPTTPTAPADYGYTRYEIEVRGIKVFADFNPSYVSGMGHIAFQSKNESEPNPLSETGYRSHFVMGSPDGMTEDEILTSLRKVAEDILNE